MISALRVYYEIEWPSATANCQGLVSSVAWRFASHSFRFAAGFWLFYRSERPRCLDHLRGHFKGHIRSYSLGSFRECSLGYFWGHFRGNGTSTDLGGGRAHDDDGIYFGREPCHKVNRFVCVIISSCEILELKDLDDLLVQSRTGLET